jgi:hypothetical protein
MPGALRFSIRLVMGIWISCHFLLFGEPIYIPLPSGAEIVCSGCEKRVVIVHVNSGKFTDKLNQAAIQQMQLGIQCSNGRGYLGEDFRDFPRAGAAGY